MAHTKVKRDQFVIARNRIIHTPTGASFSSYPGQDQTIATVNWSRCGEVLPTGEDFSRDDVGRMAENLMREQDITK